MTEEKTRPIVTIDGPAASGKGTISKKICRDLNFFHLETGIFYRVVAKEFLQRKKIQDINKFIKNLDRNIFEIDKNYKKSLFTEEVANQASSLAKLNNIRSFVLSEQLKAILQYPKKFRGVILEGRDCGTVIAPNADVKFFLNANVEIRAKRRFKQLSTHNTGLKYENILEDLTKRDQNDKNRAISPLIKAKDAKEIDCSDLSIEETIGIVKKIILSKLPNFNEKKESINGK